MPVSGNGGAVYAEGRDDEHLGGHVGKWFGRVVGIPGDAR